jgi:hypothetical protein
MTYFRRIHQLRILCILLSVEEQKKISFGFLREKLLMEMLKIELEKKYLKRRKTEKHGNNIFFIFNIYNCTYHITQSALLCRVTKCGRRLECWPSTAARLADWRRVTRQV